MTRLLIKMFIKNPENISDTKIRENYGILGSIVGIVSNILLFIVKFIIGILLNSVAITADSFNNLSDSASSIITFLGFKMANKPADKEHPFGHGRMEYISALIISFIIVLLGFEFFKSSIAKIFNPEPIVFKWISVIILFLTVAVKIWQSLFNRYIGKKINSQSLIATATDSMNDVIVTITTIISIFISHYAKINVDGFFGVFVASVLIYSGISLAKDTLSPLLGESTDPELAKKIKEMVLSYEGVLGVHDLLVHNYGPNSSMASIHVEVPYNVDINISHEIIDKIEREVAKKLGIFIVIHMDPVDIHDERLKRISETVKSCIKKFGDNFDVHDFRIVDGLNNINVIFDIVVPHGYNKGLQNNMLKDIRDAVLNLDTKYTCVINVENAFEQI